jgi:DNA-binding PadR family transcriptional regulator
MTVRLSRAQVECLHLIRRGTRRSPPLIYSIVQALVKKGYVEEFRSGGEVLYRETEKGKQFP